MSQRKLNGTIHQIKFKTGAEADRDTTVTKNLAVEGEPFYVTDEKAMYIFDGTAFVFIGGDKEIIKRTTSAAGNYTVLVTDRLIAKTGITGGGDTVTLPSTAVEGQVFIIKDEAGGAGTDNITIATAGSENIDGSASTTISTNYGTLTVYFDGSNYFSI